VSDPVFEFGTAAGHDVLVALALTNNLELRPRGGAGAARVSRGAGAE
jgi:hypothetical protein